MAPRKIHDTPSMRVMAYRKRRQEGMKRLEIWLTDEELAQFDHLAATLGSSRARVVSHLLKSAGAVVQETGHDSAVPARPEPIDAEAVPTRPEPVDAEAVPARPEPTVTAPPVPPEEMPAAPAEPPSLTVAEILRAAEAAHPGWMTPPPEPPEPAQPEPTPFVLMPPLKNRKPGVKPGESDAGGSSGEPSGETGTQQRTKRGQEVFLASLKNLNANR
ncbi:hypothetical protein SIID45300_01990 [Candidatus Magnetaquicoccaceae bacterium FCR-1]|uniref:Ribbon-helix-helix protein CopG domain-containing protein n=1 Tax=Candidatus Magnetaquiglobus chichijimensis TaxID=3141448 RepID=A0ABQ0C9W1_9PROT